MKPEFLTEVEEAYNAASRVKPDAVEEFLSHNYSDRPDILQEVRSLLQHQTDAAIFERSITSMVAATAAEMLDDTQSLIGSVIGGRYVIRSRIGAGAMAEVYLADHVALKTPFALKRPLPAVRSDPDYRFRFLEEARRAVLLKHDNVTRVHDVISEGADIFVVMEHVEGETLRTRMRKMGRPFTVSEFLPIAMQCASALAAAHEKRIVHLDVKPENIMITPAGQVKICDFGVARRLASENSNDTTATSEPYWTFAGTPAYMAPEVILSHSFDERADLFSLGTVFYEMLSGHNPFAAETAMATTGNIVSGVASPLSANGLDKRLTNIVARLLVRDPDQRYGSASHVIQDLHAFHRSRRRFIDLFIDFREGIAERRWMKLSAAAVAIVVMATPFLWLERHGIATALGIYPPIPKTKVVVVLPFQVETTNRSPYYWNGVTDSLTATLNQLAPKVQVIPNSDVRGENISTAKDARRLFGANLALSGSVFELPGAFRVVLTLSDTEQIKQLRAIPLTVPADSVSLQSEIIDAAVAMLEVELGPAEQRALKLPGTNVPQAYESYLQGIGYFATHKPEDTTRAIELFHEALSEDANFALAYAGLGEAHLANAKTHSNDARFMEWSQAACEKAIDLAPNIAAGHVCLGSVYFARGEAQQAIEAYQRAVKFNPADDDAFREMARAYERLRNLEAAEGMYEKAIRVRPDYWGNYVWLAAFYQNFREQYADAANQYGKAIALAPDNPLPHAYLCGAYIFMGRYADAIQSCSESISLKPQTAAYINLGVAYSDGRDFANAAAAFEHAVALEPSHYRAVGHLARAYSWIPEKRKDASDTYLKAIELAERVLTADPHEPAANIMVARYFAMVNNRTKALSHLQIALKERPNEPHYEEIAAVIYNQLGEHTSAIEHLQRAIAGGYSITEIEAEIELDGLRQEPAIQDLITKIKLKGASHGRQ